MTCCQHSKYSFTLTERVRYATCGDCGHRWTVQLGSGKRRGDNEADGIPNEVPGIEVWS